jgi:hypothetical protein
LLGGSAMGQGGLWISSQPSTARGGPLRGGAGPALRDWRPLLGADCACQIAADGFWRRDARRQFSWRTEIADS